jgi:hypothetical protein
MRDTSRQRSGVMAASCSTRENGEKLLIQVKPMTAR